jgi:hypothetical protein
MIVVLNVELARDEDVLQYRTLGTYMRQSHMLEGDRSCCLVGLSWTNFLVLVVTPASLPLIQSLPSHTL